jgi:quercetin dioxygenase-like cupin family protein
VFGQSALVQHWRLTDTPASSPAVLHSRDGEARVVLLSLQPGEELGEHQVREAALLLVVDGTARVDCGDESVDAPAGELFRFDPAERRTVTTAGGARILLVLAPWPGEGHYVSASSGSARAR